MMEASRKRRPAQGGYARGEETRLRIIETAIPLFARLGFEAASTREIAAEAGVNPPALQYYFDSKEGLYRACAEHIADEVSSIIGPVLGGAESEASRPEASGGELIEAYCSVIGAMAELLLCHFATTSWSVLLSREEAGLGPAIAFPTMRERFIDRLHQVCARLLARILGGEPDSPEILLRMMAINGQVKAFHLGRGPMLSCLGWTQISPEHGRFIQTIVVDQTRALLTAGYDAARLKA